MLRLLPTLIVLALWVYSFVDCLNTPEAKVRNLPKVVWAIIILLFGTVLIGPIAWFLAGRPRRTVGAGSPLLAGTATATRPARAGTRMLAPDDDPEFLASLSKRLAEPSAPNGQAEKAGSAEPEPEEKTPEKEKNEDRDKD
jgi:hypothetical protein